MIGTEGIFLIIKNSISALLDWFLKIKDILPKKAIIIVDTDTGHQNFWHVGSQNGKPILQINCNFMVTNITNKPVSLANAILNGIKGEKIQAMILVKDVNSTYSGDYPIPAMGQTSVSICFIVIPKKFPKKNASMSLKIGIIDQFGQKNWIKNIIFRPT